MFKNENDEKIYYFVFKWNAGVHYFKLWKWSRCKIIADVPDYPLCMSESKDYLSQGEYYTELQLNFHFVKHFSDYVIDDAIFKINFEIQ